MHSIRILVFIACVSLTIVPAVHAVGGRTLGGVFTAEETNYAPGVSFGFRNYVYLDFTVAQMQPGDRPIVAFEPASGGPSLGSITLDCAELVDDICTVRAHVPITGVVPGTTPPSESWYTGVLSPLLPGTYNIRLSYIDTPGDIQLVWFFASHFVLTVQHGWQLSSTDAFTVTPSRTNPNGWGLDIVKCASPCVADDIDPFVYIVFANAQNNVYATAYDIRSESPFLSFLEDTQNPRVSANPYIPTGLYAMTVYYYDTVLGMIVRMSFQGIVIGTNPYFLQRWVNPTRLWDFDHPSPDGLQSVVPISAAVYGTTPTDRLNVTFILLGAQPLVITTLFTCYEVGAVPCDVDWPVWSGSMASPLPPGAYNIQVGIWTDTAVYTNLLTQTNVLLNITDVVEHTDPMVVWDVSPIRTEQLTFGLRIDAACAQCDAELFLYTRVLVDIRNANNVYAFSEYLEETNVISMRNNNPVDEFDNNPRFVVPGVYTVRIYAVSTDQQMLSVFTYPGVNIGYDAADASGRASGVLPHPNMGFGGPRASMPLSLYFPLSARQGTVFLELHKNDGPVFSRYLYDVQGPQLPTTPIDWAAGQWMVGAGQTASAQTVSRIPFGTYTAVVRYDSQWGESTMPLEIANLTHWPTAPTHAYTETAVATTTVPRASGFKLESVTSTDDFIIRANRTHVVVTSVDDPNVVVSEFAFPRVYTIVHVSYVLPHIFVQDTENLNTIHVYVFNSTTGVVSALYDPEFDEAVYDAWNGRVQNTVGNVRTTFVRSTGYLCVVYDSGFSCFPAGADELPASGWVAADGGRAASSWHIATPGDSRFVTSLDGITATTLGTSSRIYVTGRVTWNTFPFTRFVTCLLDLDVPSNVGPRACVFRSTRENRHSLALAQDGRVLMGFYDVYPPRYDVRSYAADLVGDPTTIVTLDNMSDNVMGSSMSPRIVAIAVHPVTGTLLLSSHSGEVIEYKGNTVLYYRYPTRTLANFRGTSSLVLTPQRMLLMDCDWVSQINGVFVFTDVVTRIAVHETPLAATSPLIINPNSNAQLTLNTVPLTYALFEIPVPNTVVLRIENLGTGESVQIPLPDYVTLDTNLTSVLAQLLAEPGGGLGVQSMPSNTGHAGLRVQSANDTLGLLLTPGLFSFEILYTSYASNTTVRSYLASNVTLGVSPECSNSGVYLSTQCYCAPGRQGTSCNLYTCTSVCGGYGSCDILTGNACGICDAGWDGPSCDEPQCAEECGPNAFCANPNQCECNYGLAGEDCDIPSCLGEGSISCGDHGTCGDDGLCVCEGDFVGYMCDLMHQDPTPCANGTVINSTCVCSNGWTGADCSQPVSCVNGTVVNSTCVCSQGWTGSSCSVPACTGLCGLYGVCGAQTGVCTCDDGWVGHRCTIPQCPNGCGSTGACVAPNVCICPAPAFGDRCEFRLCPTGCDIRGTCQFDTGVCECDAGWTGASCSVSTCACGIHGVCQNVTAVASCTCNAVPANLTSTASRYGSYCNETRSLCSTLHCTPGETVCGTTTQGVVECVPVGSNNLATSSGGFSAGEIAAIAVGAAAGLLVLVMFWWCRMNPRSDGFDRVDS